MPTITKGDAVEPKDICPYCSTFSCVAQTNLALKCGTAQAVLLEARAVSAESALAAEREAHAETKASLGVWIDGLNKAASRLEAAEECLRPFVDPESYSTSEEECRLNPQMGWCAVHSFRWPCPVASARAFLAGGEK